jgi:ATP-binding cassette subfamily C protein
MIAASIIMGRALAPVELAVGHWKGFLAARSAYERITNLLDVVPDEGDRMRLPQPQGALAVEQVIAAAPGGKTPILRGVSFAIQPGEVLGVVGPSAAGKSTLARVLVGVWPILNGKVRVDGADLGHWNNEQLGPCIGYLPQDVELFSGTIAENICRFGQQDDDAVVAAARMAGVHDMVQGLPQGYNTQIGDGGQALSGGQRQRIGLARALYGDPVLVVLDEPNASLDAEGEAALVNAVQQLRSNRRTVIIITHKTNILAQVDKLLILAAGEVQGFGKRDEILPRLLAPRAVPNPPAAPVAASR